MNTWLLIIPVISAMAGWIFSRLTGAYVLNKYIPKLKEQFSEKLTYRAAQLFSSQKIESKITDPELISDAMPMIEGYIDEFLSVKLPQEIPMFSMFVGNKTTDKVKEVFIIQLQALFPKVMQSILTKTNQAVDFKTVIDNEINSTQTHNLIQDELTTAMKKLGYAGLFMGFVIGAINVLIIYYFVL